jgi:hypothetical protein
MSSVLLAVVIFVIAMGNAVRQYRRQRALGLPMQWGKLFATLAGCVIVTLLALGALFAGLESDQPALGVGACVILLVGGMIWLITWVNRRWPRREGE